MSLCKVLNSDPINAIKKQVKDQRVKKEKEKLKGAPTCENR